MSNIQSNMQQEFKDCIDELCGYVFDRQLMKAINYYKPYVQDIKSITRMKQVIESLRMYPAKYDTTIIRIFTQRCPLFLRKNELNEIYTIYKIAREKSVGQNINVRSLIINICVFLDINTNYVPVHDNQYSLFIAYEAYKTYILNHIVKSKL